MNSRPSDAIATLRGGRLILVVIFGIALAASLGRALTNLYVEVLWQAQTGYLAVFWKRVAWEWGTRILAGGLVTALVFLNLKVASTTLGGIQIRRRFGNLEISEQIPRRYVIWSMTVAAALIGFWFGASVPVSIGRQALLAASAPAWGATEPVLGKDLGFYVFWFPVLRSAVTYGMIVAFLIFTLVTAGYAATGAVSWVRGRLESHSVARIHLGSVLAAFFGLLALQLWLGRYELLLDGNSDVQSIFGYADHHARMPALQTLAVLSLAAAIGTVWGSLRNRVWPVVASVAGVVLGTLLIGNVYPSIIQGFRVEPNELQRETPYIEYSLDFTRRGFGLDATDRRSFAYSSSAPVDWGRAAEQFAGLPVWNTDPLRTTFQQEQARFSYYDFDRVAIDRYPSAAGQTPVAISVRQIDPRGIQDPNWQNLRLRERYVAGLGAVASVANDLTEDGGPTMLLEGIPPAIVPNDAGIADLVLERPEIFFGTRPQAQPDYAVVTPGPDQYRSPEAGQGVPGEDFPEGIALTSGLRKALLAWRFRTANLLFSSEVNEESRLVHRRQIVARAAAIAPFLRFPETPYPVIHDGRVVWILEGFTGTRAYPLSATQEFGVRRRFVRYIRNSVKITIDAVTGDMAFYRVPIDDPLADAYEAAYPGLFRSMEEMPDELRAHLRYPRSLLDLQGRVVLQYHQETAPAFHGQQDVWQESQEFAQSTTPVPYEAEYGIYRLPGEDEARFQLTTVFVPSGRENLVAIFVGRTDRMGRPETVLMDVPVADQVRGPRLIESTIEQDPIISQQLSLWRTQGSEVWTGHLHVVPVGERILYMEPVFLASSEDAIPQLARFVVSDGRAAVMTETLTGALASLAGATGLFAADIAPPEEGRAPSSDPRATVVWPAAAEALRLLDQAEERAREGDWRGFGEALDELRALLEGQRGQGR
jgi:uncharacterized membrane protein (UPF0182 family)